MSQLLTPTIILLLLICVRSGDIAITGGHRARHSSRCAYGIVALLALIALILALVVR